VTNTVTEVTPNMISTAAPATPAPCKRGHVVARTTRIVDGKSVSVCPECVKEDKRASAARRRAKIREAMGAPSRVVARRPEAPPLPPPVEPPPAATASGTFIAVAREYLSTKQSAPKTVTKNNFLLQQLRPLHDRLVSELTLPDFLRVLTAIGKDRNRWESAHRAGGLAEQVTRYAAQHGYVRINPLPAGDLRGALPAAQSEPRAAITDPRPGDTHDSAAKRFGRLMWAIVTYELTLNSKNHPSVNAALALAPYVFVRPGELRQMEWSEVNLDGAEWLIPADRMKMRRPFRVPLSRQAMTLLRAQHEATGKGRYVFPAKDRLNARKGEQPISENAFREALRVVLALMREPREAHTMHGFRSSAKTLLTEQLRYDSELTELVLAHAKGDKVAAAYDRSQRIEERQQLMQRWADYIGQLRGEATKNPLG
jgi:integrase